MEREQKEPSLFQRRAEEYSQDYESGFYDDKEVIQDLQNYAGSLPDAELYELHNAFVFNPELQEVVGRALIARLQFYERIERGE